MKKYGYIYITTNVINAKRYIGQHTSSVFHKRYKGSGLLLVKALRKYKPKNFIVDILDWCYSLEELNAREVYWIDFYGAVKREDFYNLVCGGLVYKRTPEIIEKFKNTIYTTIEENGLTIHQKATKKRHETMSTVGEDGLTGYQRSAIKSRETQLKNRRKI